MKYDLTLGVFDRPGQLLKALEPIAKNGGNIISIIHDREKALSGYVPVSLTVDFSHKRNFEKTKIELVESGISIIKSEEIIEKANMTFILIGKVDVRKITDIAGDGIRIVDLEVSAPSSKEACIRVNVEATLESVDRFIAELKKITAMEKMVLVSSMRG